MLWLCLTSDLIIFIIEKKVIEIFSDLSKISFKSFLIIYDFIAQITIHNVTLTTASGHLRLLKI